MNLIEVTRVNGERWQISAANICGLHESSVKGDLIITILMVGNVTVQVKDQTLDTVRKLMAAALGKPVSVIGEGHIEK